MASRKCFSFLQAPKGPQRHLIFLLALSWAAKRHTILHSFTEQPKREICYSIAAFAIQFSFCHSKTIQKPIQTHRKNFNWRQQAFPYTRDIEFSSALADKCIENGSYGDTKKRGNWNCGERLARKALSRFQKRGKESSKFCLHFFL